MVGLWWHVRYTLAEKTPKMGPSRKILEGFHTARKGRVSLPMFWPSGLLYHSWIGHLVSNLVEVELDVWAPFFDVLLSARL